MGVGCRLYLAGSPRGPAYESHLWRKGWPYVHVDIMDKKNGCIIEKVVPPDGGAFEGDTILPMFVAILGHACTVLRFSVGYADRAAVPPPTQVLGAWRGEEPAAYTHDPPPSAAITYVCPCGPPPPAPGHPRGHHDPRPHAPCHSRASVSVPWIPSDSRTSAWPPPAAPPAPRPRAPLEPTESRGWRLAVRSLGNGRGWREVTRRPRTCPWPGGCPAHLRDGC